MTDLTNEQDEAVQRAETALVMTGRLVTDILRALVREVVEPECPSRTVGDKAAEMFDFFEIASARTKEVDRLQGIVNDIAEALAEIVGDEAWRVPSEGLPEMLRAALSASEKAGEALAEALQRTLRLIECDGIDACPGDWRCSPCSAHLMATEALDAWSQRKPTSSGSATEGEKQVSERDKDAIAWAAIRFLAGLVILPLIAWLLR